jgi:Protein of unknown function (DUF3592)
MTAESLTRKAAKSKTGGPGCLIFFFGVFLLAGLGFSSFFLRGAWRAVEARSWTETPCTLLESAVRSHSSSDGGDTYSIAVVYTYLAGGREQRSERYNFLGGSSSAHDSKAEWVTAHPAGTRTVCWVNPADPAEAVLDRGLSWEYLVVLIPGLFVAVGLGGSLWAFSAWRRERRARAGGLSGHLPGSGAGHAAAHFTGHPGPGTAALPAVTLGPTTLKATSPVAKFFGLLAVGAFWNGITGVFLWKVVEGWRTGAGDGCLTAFLVPFVLVGLLLLISIPHQFLAMFNPRPRLALDSALRLGEPVRLSWSWSGRAKRIRKLRLMLTGIEQASYRRGTSTTTESKTFAEITLLETDLPGRIPEGSIQVTVPADTMHTFEASSNRIHWRIDVQGEITGWPDVAEQFPVDVAPAFPGGRR